MSVRKQGYLAAFVALAVSAGSAHAVPALSSGVWTGYQEDATVANVAGIGTNRLSWGEPEFTGGPSSAFVFEGRSIPDVPTDGSLFDLGTFTHENFSIFLPSITGADLAVTLDLTGVGVDEFAFNFALDETSNTTLPCDPPSAADPARPCPDVVSIPDASSANPVEIDGVLYLLTIDGFVDPVSGELVPEFVTEEGQDNAAVLRARLVEVPTEVPAPTALSLLGLGLLAIGVRRRRRPSQG